MSPFRYQLAMENPYYIKLRLWSITFLLWGKAVTTFFIFLKLSEKTRCTILMHLGQEGRRPSTFGLFANGALKVN